MQFHANAAIAAKSSLCKWMLAFIVLLSAAASAKAQSAGQKWAASWATSIQGLYTAPTAPQGPSVPAYGPQPDLSFALPNATSAGASNQTFRMIIKPDLWGQTVRVKFSNFFGTQPISFSAATIGLQSYQANITPGTITPATFNGQSSIVIPPGGIIVSDAVQLNFVNSNTIALLRGRNLAVSFAISGSTGPLSYHDGAFSTSYISAPNSGDVTQQTAQYYFPYSTTSFFLLNELDVIAPSSTVVVCAFGDSITDGTFSTINGDDRWLNAASEVLHERYGDRVSIVNEAIAGNAVTVQVAGQPAVKRVARDVVPLSGLTLVLMLEGINDLGLGGVTDPNVIINGYGQTVIPIHNAGVLVIGGTITPSATPSRAVASNSPLGAALGPLAQNYASAQTDIIRLAINRFILTPNTGVFQDVADFASATRDPSTGAFFPSFVPNSEGSAGDNLHPNRAGYINMGFVAADAIGRLGRLQAGASQ